MRTCQYCGRPNLTNTDEVCNGCGGNLPKPLAYIPSFVTYNPDTDEMVIAKDQASRYFGPHEGGFSPAVDKAVNTYRLHNIKGAFSRLMRPK